MAIGLYGPEYLQFDSGGPAAEVKIFVFLPGTKTKAQLYADSSGLYTGPNPIWTDRRGELVFYAQTGSYDLYYEDGATPITVPITIPSGSGVDLDEYVHVQTVAAEIWTITHNLAAKPHFVVEENVGMPDFITYPAARYLDANTMELVWGYAASGRATLRR
ncbi:MAG: hypothetical protein AB7L09_22195 [Nitrospira sp.]